MVCTSARVAGPRHLPLRTQGRSKISGKKHRLEPSASGGLFYPSGRDFSPPASIAGDFIILARLVGFDVEVELATSADERLGGGCEIDEVAGSIQRVGDAGFG